MSPHPLTKCWGAENNSSNKYVTADRRIKNNKITFLSMKSGLFGNVL
jgi:hypothetical protein